MVLPSRTLKPSSLQNTGRTSLGADYSPGTAQSTLWLLNTLCGTLKATVMERRGVSTYMITELEKITAVIVRKKISFFFCFVLFYKLSGLICLSSVSCHMEGTPQCSDRAVLRGRDSLLSSKAERPSPFLLKYQFLQLPF